jgi:hypothetical protein
VIRAIWDLFKWLVAEIERLLYGMDEWFRFRRGKNPVLGAVKFFFGVFWVAISYVARMVVVLILEPTINPIKHFPVVTVAGKFMLLLLPVLPVWLYENLGMRPGLAVSVTSVVVFGLPGIFGFLVWELKENWRLYRANRSAALRPVLVGHHGEKMPQFLRPGFHSGTIPKTFARWRRAEQRQSSRASARAERQLAHVEESIRHFVQREFVHLLEESRLGRTVSLTVDRVALTILRIRVEIARAQSAHPSLVLEFLLDERSLSARVAAPGWLDQLPAADQAVVHMALAGMYRLADATDAPILWQDWVDYWEGQRADGMDRDISFRAGAPPLAIPAKKLIQRQRSCPCSIGPIRLIGPIGLIGRIRRVPVE